MTIYICLLRGINVGGHKRIKMDKLRQSFQALGFEQVRTFIQSGNVVFKSGKVSSTTLSKRIEKTIFDDFGFSVSVVTRTVDEINDAIENNPFVKKPGIDPEKLHVAFLSESPSPEALKRLTELTSDPDQSRCIGKELYLYLPNGASESKLMRNSVDRVLSVIATTRNWKTVNSLHQMCRDWR